MTLAYGCYSKMFNDCASLAAAPKELPAPKLTAYCYESMFEGCTSLTTAPAELPATELAEYCYKSMFKGCSQLTETPKMTAENLPAYCNTAMFY